MFGIPAESPYDLRFRLLGIPVRVHWFFWIIAAMLGGVGNDSLGHILTWVGCVFLSIVVHEMGHGLMTRLFGGHPNIVLFGMGGVCYTEAERQTPGQRLAVLIMGPGAGFLLAGLVYLVYRGLARSDTPVGELGGYAIGSLLWINIVWGLLNLLPIWPLDGGQITGVLLGLVNRRNGLRWTHVLSMLVAGVLAFFAYQRLGDIFLTLFLGLFALTNYQMLQALHQQSRYGSFEDEGEWWRR